jgi:hypothetical protein
VLRQGWNIDFVVFTGGVDCLSIDRFRGASDQGHCSAVLHNLKAEPNCGICAFSVLLREDDSILKYLLNGIAFR